MHKIVKNETIENLLTFRYIVFCENTLMPKKFRSTKNYIMWLFVSSYNKMPICTYVYTKEAHTDKNI